MNFKANISILFATVLLMVSCAQGGPKKISKGEQCDNCKMIIEDLGYSAEIVTAKGKAYKFDDVKCMNSFASENADKTAGGKTYVADFPTGNLIEFEKATFIHGGNIKSPMGGNMQAYSDKTQAEKARAEFGAN